MKTLNNINTKLVLLFIAGLFFVNTNLLAQRESDDDYSEEEETQFFDDINSSRFESDFGTESTRPKYDYKINSRDYDFGREQTAPVQSYDWTSDPNVNNWSKAQGTVTIGGGNASGVPPVIQQSAPTSNSAMFGLNQNPTPPVKKGGNIDAVPDNPGDPDLPLDGGIGFLIASSLAFGTYKRIKKS